MNNICSVPELDVRTSIIGIRWWFSTGHFVMFEICWTSLISRTSSRDCITLRWKTCIQPLKHVTKHFLNPLSGFANQLVPHFWIYMQCFVCAACILVHHFAAFGITYHIHFPVEDQQRNCDLWSTAFNLFHNSQKLQSSCRPWFTSVSEEGMKQKAEWIQQLSHNNAEYPTKNSR